MRLWHYELISYLDRQRLLSQHRECCAMRGKGWGKKHSTVDYAFKYPYIQLYHYHMLVMHEMEKRGYNVDQTWKNSQYRGKILGYDTSDFTEDANYSTYPEHNDSYRLECLNLLIKKNEEKPTEVDYVTLKEKILTFYK